MDRDQVLCLLNPLETTKCKTRNRFLRSATYLGTADSVSGAIGAAEIGRLTELAAGGVGTVISGYAYVSSEGQSAPKQWGLHTDERIGDVHWLADALHKYNSRLIVQIAHAGGQRSVEGKTVASSPSGLPHPGTDRPTKALLENEIADVCGAFAAAARRVKEGGADAVEIHGGHGFLLTQFLSPSLNKRQDHYGGAIENRARIFFDIYNSVRESVGESFPVWFKISVEEGVPSGYTVADGLFVCRKLLEHGVDGIEVSSGASYAGALKQPSVIGVSAGESEAPFKAYARQAKKLASSEQIITLTGGMRSLETMAELLAEGYCDLLGISRPLIAEADLINRWYEEDARPAACISCNACFKTAAYGPITCPVWRDRHEGNWDPL